MPADHQPVLSSSGLSPGVVCPLREAERLRAQVSWGTSCEVPRLPSRAGAPSGAPPRRFTTQPPRFLAWTGGLHPTLSGQHLRRRSSRPVQPLKADPSSGSGSDRASWDEVTSLACKRRLPRSANGTSPETPSVSGNGKEHNRNKTVRQAYSMQHSASDIVLRSRCRSLQLERLGDEFVRCPIAREPDCQRGAREMPRRTV